MLKLKKISNRAFLVSLSIFNAILLFSFLIELFIHFNWLPDSLLLLALPIELLSSNFLFVALIIAIEILIIVYCWIRTKRTNTSSDIIEEVTATFDFLAEEDEELDLDVLENDNHIESINEEIWSEGVSVLEYSQVMESSENTDEQIFVEDETTPLLGRDDFEFSPGLLSGIDETANYEINSIQGLDKNPRVSKQAITDHQFALYQNIVNIGWLYEKGSDRERIGFDQNSIDESNISLSDISKLMKSGMVFKQQIQHPTGSFVVYSSNPYIEKKIILESIRRISRKKRFKFISRKIEFPNWKEFGLQKRAWQFDFEMPDKSIIGTVWADDSFSILEETTTIIQEKREELKALIAASSLKVKGEGIALLITNNKNHLDIVKKFAKKVGWGKVVILNFADSKFIDKFHTTLAK